jgi:hypothetical protein
VVVLVLIIGFVYSKADLSREKCHRKYDLSTAKYHHIPGSEQDSWHINKHGYIWSKKIERNCKVCFKMELQDTTSYSYYAFSVWEYDSPMKRIESPITLDKKLYSDGIALFKKHNNEKYFCIISKKKLYLKLQHSFEDPGFEQYMDEI